MESERECPTCRREVPHDAPGGLCPYCLLDATDEQDSGGSKDPTIDSHRKRTRGYAAPDPDQLSELLPQLEVIELLGAGGMGAVYKARQKSLDRLVALKIITADAENIDAFAERFTREAKALAKLSHPNIVAVHDFGEINAVFYLIMEYVDGPDLRDLIATQELSPEQALAIVPQVCGALQYAHDEGVVHRDIKPENILIDRNGAIKVADFGLAKLLTDRDVAQGLTATDQVVGTVRYMAPEQLEGSSEIDHRADIYSLGVVFYELLTGELPLGRFAAPSEKAQIDARIDEIVLRALEKRAQDRYQHASDIKEEVERISGMEPKQEAHPGPPPVPAPVAGNSMEWHVDLVGYLNIGLSILVMFAGLVVMIAMFVIADNGAAQGRNLLQGLGILTAIVTFAISLPGLLAGKGLLDRRPWARVVAIILGALNLINFPIGTLIGVYMIWALSQPEAVALFPEEAAPNRAVE